MPLKRSYVPQALLKLKRQQFKLQLRHESITVRQLKQTFTKRDSQIPNLQ